MEKLILLIDDDTEEHELFLAAIEKVGANCAFMGAAGMDEAMSILRQITPDFIFLDINMPAKNGFTCLSEIRKTDSCKAVPVEMYSTSISERDIKKARDLGASGYLVKSTSFHQLCESVKQVLVEQKLI